jgi:acetyltransferase-like isoleucine patch superfamily enzyme
VRLTVGVKITTHDGGLWVLRNNGKLKNADKFGKVKIGNNVHIGLNTIIMPGVTIGDNVIIGCGAVVTKDIPSNSVAVGVPAKVMESIDDYYRKVKDKVVMTKNLSADEKRTFLEKKICGGS